jgi:glycosyltransferase involved in cell wall biosynthesis
MNAPLIEHIFFNDPDTYPPIVNSVRELSRYGYSQRLFVRATNRSWNVRYPESAEIVRLGSRFSPPLEFCSFFVQAWRRSSKKVSLLIGSDMHGFAVAHALSIRYRKPLVYYCHEYSSRSNRLPLGSSIVRIYEQQFAKCADLVIAPDADRAAAMKEGLGLHALPLIVPNAPLARLGGSGEGLHEAIARQGKRFDRILLRQGRIGAGHAIEVTIKSIPLWESKTWGFVVIGPGEGEYARQVQELAAQLKVSDQFVILPPVSYDDLARVTPGADLGHGLYEPINFTNQYYATSSNKIMEYLAAGVPLLVDDVPPLRRIIEQHNCGVLADVKSPESIAKQVNSILGSPETMREMRASAIAAFESAFCFRNQFTKVKDAIERLISSSSAMVKRRPKYFGATK